VQGQMLISKRRLASYLKGKQIAKLHFEIETIEGQTRSGFRNFRPGRMFVHMELT